MPIVIDTTLFVAIMSLLFLFGIISGIKIAYTRITINLLKKLNPKDFEKLLERENESGKHSTTNIGCMHKQSEGETPKHKVSSR